jgi:hypothetical protein
MFFTPQCLLFVRAQRNVAHHSKKPLATPYFQHHPNDAAQAALLSIQIITPAAWPEDTEEPDSDPKNCSRNSQKPLKFAT